MKKLLLVALMASGLAFVPVQHSDAGVSVAEWGVGVSADYSYYRPYPEERLVLYPTPYPGMGAGISGGPTSFTRPSGGLYGAFEAGHPRRHPQHSQRQR